MSQPVVQITLPDWVDSAVDWERPYRGDEAKVALAIELARENVRHDTGGPFGSAVFERDSGRLVAVGVNRVLPLNNSVLHGEIVAFMMAQQRVGSYTLGAPNLPRHELATSCDPCAMCLGAALWSGVKRVVCGATREDAMALNFDEGPVFPESFDYMARRGVEVVRGVLREEGAAVLRMYVERSGEIYNG